jgi:hypothetical protein
MGKNVFKTRYNPAVTAPIITPTRGKNIVDLLRLCALMVLSPGTGILVRKAKATRKAFIYSQAFS